MKDTPTQVDLSERPVSVADGRDVSPPRPRKVRLLVAVVAAVGLALLLTAPVTGRIVDLVSLDRAEVVTESPAVFPVAETPRPVVPSVFEELEARIAELVERLEAQRRAGEAKGEDGAGSSAGSGSVTKSQASVSAGSARASSSSQVDVSQSVSGGGSVSSSVSVSNSSSSSASSGGSVAVSGSSSSEVSSSQGGSASTSSCVSEVVTSTEVNGVAETSRQVSRSC